MTLLTKAVVVILFFAFISGVIALLPDAASHPVPASVNEAFVWMYSSIAPMDYIIPLRLILDLFTLSLAFEVGKWGWRIIKTIIDWVKYFMA